VGLPLGMLGVGDALAWGMPFATAAVFSTVSDKSEIEGDGLGEGAEDALEGGSCNVDSASIAGAADAILNLLKRQNQGAVVW